MGAPCRSNGDGPQLRGGGLCHKAFRDFKGWIIKLQRERGNFWGDPGGLAAEGKTWRVGKGKGGNGGIGEGGGVTTK